MPWKRNQSNNFAELIGALATIMLLIGIGFAVNSLMQIVQ